MKVSEAIDMQGRLILQKRNAANEILEEIAAKNDIVLSGRDLVAKLFINEAIDPLSHIAVGTGATTVDPTANTTLENELFRKLIDPIDPTQHLTTTGDNKKKVTITAELDFSEAKVP